MNQQELEKFIQEYNIQSHFYEEDQEQDCILYLGTPQLEIFRSLLNPDLFASEAYPIFMRERYFCIELKGICDYHEIDLKKVKDSINKQYDKTRN